MKTAVMIHWAVDERTEAMSERTDATSAEALIYRAASLLSMLMRSSARDGFSFLYTTLPKRFPDQFLRFGQQSLFIRLSPHTLPPDVQQHRHSQRRYALKPAHRNPPLRPL